MLLDCCLLRHRATKSYLRGHFFVGALMKEQPGGSYFNVEAVAMAGGG